MNSHKSKGVHRYIYKQGGRRWIQIIRNQERFTGEVCNVQGESWEEKQTEEKGKGGRKQRGEIAEKQLGKGEEEKEMKKEEEEEENEEQMVDSKNKALKS